MYSKDETDCLEKAANILKTKIIDLLALVKENPKNDIVYMDLQNINSIVVKLNDIVRSSNYELNKTKITTDHIYVRPPKEINIALSYFITEEICISFFKQIRDAINNYNYNPMLVSPTDIKEAEHAISERILILEDLNYYELKISMMNLLELIQSFKHPCGVAANVENNNE